jgi:pyruvate/2-oxoglutarate dehydrogenase complex dihydrolipoamide dehydrogenase (E3) component
MNVDPLPSTPLLLPDDPYNRALLANAHPADWKNPKPQPRYNLVVIGGGTAGLISALGAAGLGGKVALVERHLLGGDCLNVGCVPSKGVLRAAHAFHEVQQASAFGVQLNGVPTLDFAAAMERMRRLRAQISPNDSAARLASLGVDVFLGEARFTGRETVEVAGETLRFTRAVIASGARAAALPIPGLADAGFFTNETIFSLTELPRRLAVIGGGPIGCELAQSFRRFGAEVTMLAKDAQLLPREDADAAAVVTAQFLREGIVLALGSELLRVEQRGTDKVIVHRRDGQEHEVAVDAILVAAGRKPNIEGLGLEAAGVTSTAAGVAVDDHLRTDNPKIFAAGDVCSKLQFTHAADALARIVIQNALFWGSKRASTLTIPWATYTDPEVAHVGLTEQEARARGLEVTTHTVKLEEMDRAILDGETEGFARIHVDPKGRLLGATLVARHAGEMIGPPTLVMTQKLTVSALASTIAPYPTQAEVWKRLGDAHARTRLTPTVKALFERILRWKR